MDCADCTEATYNDCVRLAYARWGALTRDERRLVVQSAAVVATAAAALRVFGLQRTLRGAMRPVHRGTPDSHLPPEGGSHHKADEIRAVVTAVNRAGRYVPGGTCLSRSLALAWMLRGRGVAADVRIGAKASGEFAAHAWVEHAGVALNDAPDVADRFLTLVGSKP